MGRPLPSHNRDRRQTRERLPPSGSGSGTTAAPYGHLARYTTRARESSGPRPPIHGSARYTYTHPRLDQESSDARVHAACPPGATIEDAVTAFPPQGDFHDSTTGAFLRGMLRAVNSVRARHHAPPVRLHEGLTRYARSRMREIHPGREPGRGDRGFRLRTSEVLYWGSSSRRRSGAADAREAVDQWYTEAPEYDFDNPGFNPRTGHFTQLVWRRSALMGAARAVGGAPGKYETYIAVEFEHCGNVEGEFMHNVFPPVRRAPRIFLR
ncbi:CAP domain-containing protein [Streptomyces shenzhenensis]|uniref:SCP domain-containing protein n=1 Tax=Streptomyces shenzhenensis TaxID=943815 RepID=A0A3M0HT16_9ACTN|nr:CAP domain-containing protein [Streptomyces shenzhenensis]RMB80611.1 hypothetical protein CTZ28_39440 [Streptomyces shenzhenensis]